MNQLSVYPRFFKQRELLLCRCVEKGESVFIIDRDSTWHRHQTKPSRKKRKDPHTHGEKIIVKMGIVSSTFLSLAIEFAWNFQRYLDPRYRYVEPKTLSEHQQPLIQSRLNECSDEIDIAACKVVNKSPEVKSTYQENRNRRAAQLRSRRKRPSSYDAALIVKSMNKNGVYLSTGQRVVSSTPNTLKRQQAPCWNVSSSSSMSSSEDSDVDLKSENSEKFMSRRRATQPTVPAADEASGEEQTMTAAEEAAFRMALGRGHFSKSKKDRFLNHLRLEKRMNDLNREFFELACRAHTRSLHRHHSGDLKKIL